MEFTTSRRFLLQLFSITLFFNTVLGLLGTESQVTLTPSTEDLPLLPPDTQERLSHLFLKCSTECSGLPDCLGITIYKLNSESEQLRDSADSFTCVPTLNDDLNNLQTGKLFYKIMFKDKLPKFNRRNFAVRNSREITADNVAYNQNYLRKRDLPMVEPPCAAADTKIEPIKIDPLFTEATSNTTVASPVEPSSAPLHVPCSQSSFGENKSSSSSEISNEVMANSTSSPAADFSSSGILSSSSHSENSSEESNAFKSSVVSPVKIDSLFSDSAAAVGAPADSNSVPLHVPSTDSLFGENNTSSSSTISNEGIVNSPSTTTTSEITADSNHLSSSSSSGILSSNSHSENSSEESNAINTFKSSAVSPVKIDSLFTDSAAATGATADSNSVPLHVPSTDSLFGENNTSSSSDISKEGIVNGPSTTTAAELTADSGNLSSISSSGISSSNTGSDSSSKESSIISTFESSTISPVKIDTTADSESATPHGPVVPNTDSLFGENNSSTATTEILKEKIINNPSTTANTEGKVDSGHLSSFSSSGISSSSSNLGNSSEESSATNSFKTSDSSPVKVDSLFADSSKVEGANIDTKTAPVHVSSTDSLFGDNNTSSSPEISQEGKVHNPSTTTFAELTTDSGNFSSISSSGISSSSSNSKISSEEGSATFKTATISPVKVDSLFSDSAKVAVAGAGSNDHSSTTGSNITSSISENAGSAVTSTPDAEISQNSFKTSSIEPVKIDSLFNEPKHTSTSVPGETLFESNVSSSVMHSVASNSSGFSSNNVSPISSSTSSILEGENTDNLKHSSANLLSAENSENKASENFGPSKTENVGIATSSVGGNAVTDIPKITLDDTENTEGSLFGSGESSANLSDTENHLTVDSTGSVAETISKEETKGQSNGNQDKTTISHPETILIPTEVPSKPDNPNALLSLIKGEKIMKIGIPALVKCNENSHSSENFSDGQSGAIVEIPLATPETHPELQTGTDSEVSNSHRIFAGESSTEKTSSKNEYSYLPYESSNSHKAEVSEVTNQDGSTSIVLKTVVKIKLEDESVDSDSHRLDSTESTQSPVPDEEPVTSLKQLLESQSTDMECRFQDRERYLRNIRGTAYSILNGSPTLLSFVSGVQSHCVGTLMKNGTKGMRDIESIIPGFPSDTEIEAAGFLNGRLYIIDSSKEQKVWSSDYDFNTRQYSEAHEVPMRQCVETTKQEFFEMCQIDAIASETRIKAFAQVSLNDNSCIIFDDSRQPILSENASDEALSLAKAISFLLEAQFINYVEAVFSWLDESFISSVYIYGSDGDLFRLFRNSTTEFQWQTGNYELLPYPELPLKP